MLAAHRPQLTIAPYIYGEEQMFFCTREKKKKSQLGGCSLSFPCHIKNITHIIETLQTLQTFITFLFIVLLGVFDLMSHLKNSSRYYIALIQLLKSACGCYRSVGHKAISYACPKGQKVVDFYFPIFQNCSLGCPKKNLF